MKNFSPLLKKIARLRILVVGDVMLDHYIWGNAHRISPEAPVPVVEVAEDSYVPGGAANVALNCTSLGAKTTLAGFMGKDEAGEQLRKLLRTAKIKTISTKGNGATIIKSRVILQHQQLCRLDREDLPKAYEMKAAAALRLLRKELSTCDAVLFSDYAKGVVTEELVNVIAKEAKAMGKFVALDPKPKRPIQFTNVDLISPNRMEAAQLAGREWHPGHPFPAAEICQLIHEKYQVKHLVVTLSEDGLLLSTEGKIIKQIPTAAREVSDPSGCGDTSLAGLVLAVLAGAKLETAAHLANAAAGVVAGKLGTATVTPQELLAYTKRQS